MQVMTTSILQLTPRSLAIASINTYQTHISPRKGFSCAHRMLHGGESCSEHIKTLLGEGNFSSILQQSRQRFKACAEASYSLKATKAGFRCIVIPCCLPL